MEETHPVWHPLESRLTLQHLEDESHEPDEHEVDPDELDDLGKQWLRASKGKIVSLGRAA